MVKGWLGGSADAAGLSSPEHAAAVAELLRDRHGHDAVVATSAEPDARARIEAFSAGTDPWLVAVKMVSEGVDIPRLRVGVYATTVATELFFRQVVGRFVRVEDPGAGEHAVVLIPDDPRLRGLAATMAEMRDHVLEADLGTATDPIEPVAGGGRAAPGFVPIASEAFDTGGIVAGQVVDPALVAEARRVLAGIDQATAQRFTVGDVALLLAAAGPPSSWPSTSSSCSSMACPRSAASLLQQPRAMQRSDPTVAILRGFRYCFLA